MCFLEFLRGGEARPWERRIDFSLCSRPRRPTPQTLSAGAREGKGTPKSRLQPRGPHLGGWRRRGGGGEHAGPGWFHPTSGPCTARSTWEQTAARSPARVCHPGVSLRVRRRKRRWRELKRVSPPPPRAPLAAATTPRSAARTWKVVPGAAHKPRGAEAPARGRMGARVAGAAGAGAGGRDSGPCPPPRARGPLARLPTGRHRDSGRRPPRRSLELSGHLSPVGVPSQTPFHVNAPRGQWACRDASGGQWPGSRAPGAHRCAT